MQLQIFFASINLEEMHSRIYKISLPNAEVGSTKWFHLIQKFDLQDDSTLCRTLIYKMIPAHTFCFSIFTGISVLWIVFLLHNFLISFKTSSALAFEIDDNKETLTSKVSDNEGNELRLVCREFYPIPEKYPTLNKRVWDFKVYIS